MRFGIFIPQGWRLDLVGIEPTAQWEVMRDLAAHADANPVFNFPEAAYDTSGIELLEREVLPALS